MKLKFFVESLKFHPESKVPSIIVYITNKTEYSGPASPVVVSSFEDVHKETKKIIDETMNYYHTSFLIDLSQYRKSSIAVGDIIEMDISVANKGEIMN